MESELFGIYETEGRRDGMEDASDVLVDDDMLLVGVFDGHGGDGCSRFLKDKLLSRIRQRILDGQSPATALEKSFLSVDKDYCNLAEKLELEDGSTCTVLLLINDEYYLAATGDSRAVMVYNSKVAKPLSIDHKPDRRDERQRITKSGGEVEYDHFSKTYRVVVDDLGLAVTRAIGDYLFKPVVTAKPEIQHGKLDDDAAFVCMASDGLWDDVTNEDAGKVLLEEDPERLEETARMLADIALSLGSEDNITVACVNLARWMEINKEKQASRKEARLQREQAELEALDRRSRKKRIKSTPTKRFIPGLSEDGYLSELLLWKSPLRTFLWLCVGSLTFFLSYVAGYSMLSLVSYVLMMQIVITVFVLNSTKVLKRLKLVGEDFDSTLFVLQGSLFSDEVVQRASDVTFQIVSYVFDSWNAIVHDGSVTRILASLRFISYLFSPLPLDIMLFVTFLGLFSLPVSYHHNRVWIDKQYQKLYSSYKSVQRKLNK